MQGIAQGTALRLGPLPTQRHGHCCHHILSRPAASRTSAPAPVATVELGNNGGLWLQGGSLADLFFGPVSEFGAGFVMAREKHGPGLVLQKHCSAVQLVDRDERQRVLALQQVLQGPAPVLANFVQDLEAIDVTDFATVLEDAVNVTPSAARCLPGAAFPPTECMGIVWKGRDPLDEVYDEEGELIETTHARRTKAVRFTCKLCGTTMTKAVNPHAWEQGSVFARCDGPKCKVIHNLVDNLRIIKYLRL